MSYPRPTDDPGSDDEDDSTISSQTMWENLLSFIGGTAHDDNISNSLEDAPEENGRGKAVAAKTLLIPVAICFILPLVGMGVLSAIRPGTTVESYSSEDTSIVELIQIEDLSVDANVLEGASADSLGIVPTDQDGGEDNVQLIEEFFAAMKIDWNDSSEIHELATVCSDNTNDELTSDERPWEDVMNMKAVHSRPISPDDSSNANSTFVDKIFLETMATDWCVLNETAGSSQNAPINRVSPESLDVESEVGSFLNHSAQFSFAINPSDKLITLSANFSTGLKFVINPDIDNKIGASSSSTTASNHSRYIKNAYVNPNYLHFIANIKIRYETTSRVTNFPTNLQHSLQLKVVPKDTFQAHTSRRNVVDVHCPHQYGMLCNSSSTSCYEQHSLDCRSTAHFWIGFDSLLKGLGDAESNHYRYFVTRTVRFVLFRKSESNSDEVVDWWDLTAKIPLESDHERWTLGYYKSSYTVDLEDVIVGKPESFVNMEEKPIWDQTLLKTTEVEDQAKIPEYHQNQYQPESRSSSESHNDSESQDSAWEKLLYGCLSGLVAGLGVLAPVLGPDIVRSVAGDNKEAASFSANDACENDCRYASPARPSPASSNASADPFVKETIEITHVPLGQRQQDPKTRILHAGIDNSNHGPSLPPVYPKQNQRTSRKKMHSRRFGIGSENSATPRRGNLTSNQAPTRSSEATCADSEASFVDFHSHTAEENRESIFYAPQFDTDMPDSLPHSNTLSSQEELLQHERQDGNKDEINESSSLDAETDSSNTKEVSEDDRETYSPPTIERMIDPIPFVNLAPFPASKVTLERQAGQEKSPIGTREEALAQSPVTDNNELLNSEDGHQIVAKEDSPMFVVESQKETTVPTSSMALEGIAPNSPVPSDASLTFDANNNSSYSDAEFDLKAVDSAESKTENEVGSNIEFSSLAMPPVPSPRKRTRRSSSLVKGQAASSRSPVETAAADKRGVDSTPSQPMIVDRPIARSCGDPGQSKKFASSPTSDELSFKSGSTFHDCGGERIGHRVAKDFNGVTLFGTVTEYDGRVSPEIWRVCYDDGNAHKEYCTRHELTNAILHYEAHKANDLCNAENVMMANLSEPSSQQTSESQETDSKSDDTWTRKEKKARDRKRARAERRLLRTARKPAIHKPASALIPLSQAIDEPVWEFSRKRKSI